MEAPGPAGKGLARGAMRLPSSIAVGVASATPTVGVALVFGLMVTSVGFQLPAVMLLGFVPIVLTASAYRALNRADPDCGTTFAWVARALGPYVGWFAGFLLVATLAIVVANYAQMIGAYGLLLVGADGAAGSTAAVTVAGVTGFAAVTALACAGTRLSSRVQLPVLMIGLVVLLGFAVTALVRGIIESPAGAVVPSPSWFDPFELTTGELAAGVVGATLLYWGWETSTTVNEETDDPARTPGLAAIGSTVALAVIYVICGVGILAFAGPARIAEQPEDVLALLGSQVLGDQLNWLLTLMVLAAVIAGAVFLPVSGARALLSMASHGALPAGLARVHARRHTPTIATLTFSAAGVAYFVAMTLASESTLLDSLSALGLLVAFNYALTALACVVLFRKHLRSSRHSFVALGLAPLAGAVALLLVMVKAAVDAADPEASATGSSCLGLGAPLVIAGCIVLAGLLGLGIARLTRPEFFRS